MNNEKNLGKDTKEIFDLANKAVPYVYRDGNGEYVTEKLGTYCAFITRDMIKQMKTLSVLLLSKYPELSEIMRDVSDVMKKKDLTICRMLDDMKAERELSLYEYDDTEKAVNKLKSIYEGDLFDEAPFDFYKPRLKEWVRRFVMLDIRAYYISSRDFLKSSLKLASMRAFDDDGNLVFGISKEDEESVKIMAKMESLLLKALIRLPVYTDELSECLEKINRMEWIIEAVTSGKSELLAYLSKCMEAAKEFDDTNE
nr:hypothetical protein [uncultured Butyrivibrio sp.]